MPIPTFAENLQHVKHPQVGDYWQEHMVPIAVIVSVDDFHVTTCEKLIDHPEGGRTFDFSRLNSFTREQFYKRSFRYGSINNEDFQATDDEQVFGNKFWCDVVPAKYKTWMEKFKENRKAEISSW